MTVTQVISNIKTWYNKCHSCTKYEAKEHKPLEQTTTTTTTSDSAQHNESAHTGVKFHLYFFFRGKQCKLSLIEM